MEWRLSGIHPLFILASTLILTIGVVVFSVIPNIFQEGPSAVFAQSGDGTSDASSSVSAPYQVDQSEDGTSDASSSVSAPYPINQSGDGTSDASSSVSAPYPVNQSGAGSNSTTVTQQLHPLTPATPSQPAPSSATRTYVGGMCIGNDSWWVWKYSGGSITKIQNFGHQPGECGNPSSQQSTSVQPQVFTPTTTNTSSAATITYQGGMCNGNDAWWVKKWSDGHIDWVQNFGHQPGECGNPASGTQTTTAQTPIVTHNGTSYPQCGGTVGLEGLASNHTIIVTPVLDSNGNIVRYDHNDQGIQAGQCGNPQSTNVVQAAAPVVSTAVCNDDVTYFDPSVGQYIHKHGGRAYNPASAYETQTKDANGCIYAFDQVAAPLVTTCKGQISENDLESQLHGANYPGPFGLQYQSAEVQAYNNAACPVVTPTPTPTASALVTNVTCPSGTTATMNGNTVVCVSTSPALTSTPVSTETRQLPETGVPLASVSLAGLVPLGLKLKRFNKFTEKINGQSIWKDREFKSVLK